MFFFWFCFFFRQVVKQLSMPLQLLICLKSCLERESDRVATGSTSKRNKHGSKVGHARRISYLSAAKTVNSISVPPNSHTLFTNDCQFCCCIFTYIFLFARTAWPTRKVANLPPPPALNQRNFLDFLTQFPPISLVVWGLLSGGQRTV